MYELVVTGRMLKEGWITPSQVGDAYRGAMDTLHAHTGVFGALGNTTLIFGFAVLLSVPLFWALCRLNKV